MAFCKDHFVLHNPFQSIFIAGKRSVNLHRADAVIHLNDQLRIG
jgi:hypothetical protein